jgi:hypothetical protein
MSNKSIFISCGQGTENEKTTGILLKTVVDGEPGFRAYFAETVHDFGALADHVLKGIQECAGAIVVLQDRGRVVHPDGSEWGHRSSVWVNQELAILAYRQFFESKKLPVIAFIDPQVKLEGAMTALIVNPQPLPPISQLPDTIKSWLRSADFTESNNAVFLSKWQQLTDSAKRVIAVLIDEGGKDVRVRYPTRAQQALWNRCQHHGLPATRVEASLHEDRSSETHPKHTQRRRTINPSHMGISAS